MGVEIGWTTRTCGSPATARAFSDGPKKTASVISIEELSRASFGEQPTKAWASSKRRVKLKKTDQVHADTQSDIFEAELEIANVSDRLSVTTDDILASNDGNGAEWTLADRTTTRDDGRSLFPFQVDPFSSTTLAVKCVVEYCPREDHNCDKCGILIEYIWTGTSSYKWQRFDDTTRGSDLLYITCDDTNLWKRANLSVQELRYNYLYSVDFGTDRVYIPTEILRGAVLRAEQLSEYLLDVPARKVYAFKLVVSSPTTSTVAFFPIAPHGDAAGNAESDKVVESTTKYEKLIKRLSRNLLEPMFAN
ncbi:hypothetical protein BJ742DRAFT_778983 [Cladochytrium replicatum]|nr:hypothetical protein BJ742DRAFT_778983 [Cladochytrium replicatum]